MTKKRFTPAYQADPEQIGLTREAQLVVSDGHFFALPNRPALASVSSGLRGPTGATVPLQSKKIILQRQLANLRVQRFDVDFGLSQSLRFVIKDIRHTIEELIFPLLDLVGMLIELRS